MVGILRLYLHGLPLRTSRIRICEVSMIAGDRAGRAAASPRASGYPRAPRSASIIVTVIFTYRVGRLLAILGNKNLSDRLQPNRLKRNSLIFSAWTACAGLGDRVT